MPRPSAIRAVHLAAVVAVLAALHPGSAAAQEAMTSPYAIPLRMVERLGVLVEDVAGDVEGLALTPARIQAEAELQLRRAGLRINPENVTPPTLYFQVSVLCSATGTCAVDISSAVLQYVYLEPDAPRPFRAKTWHTGEILLVPRDEVDARVVAAVQGQVDALAADLIQARASWSARALGAPWQPAVSPPHLP